MDLEIKREQRHFLKNSNIHSKWSRSLIRQDFRILMERNFNYQKFIIWANLQGLQYNKYLISWFLLLSGINCSVSARVLTSWKPMMSSKVKMKMNQAWTLAPRWVGHRTILKKMEVVYRLKIGLWKKFKKKKVWSIIY